MSSNYTNDRRAFTLIELPATRKREGSAFTLIELLVVIAIIALLVTLLQEAKRQAKVVICSTNFRGIAMGMTAYAAEDERNAYPLHDDVWPNGVWFSVYYPPDKYAWIDMFVEKVCGGTGGIMNCPFRKIPLEGQDPRYGDWFWWVFSGGVEAYFHMSIRLGGWSWGGVDWTASGNTDPEGMPPMQPGTSRDAIWADTIQSDQGSHYFTHADDPYDYTTHRENNVAYSDGHAETHHHEITEVSPYALWDEHYII